MMIKIKRWARMLPLLMVAIIANACSPSSVMAPEPGMTSSPGPGLMPRTSSEMESADYWIALIDHPDDLVMSEQSIKARNRVNYDNPDAHVNDLAHMAPNISGASLLRQEDTFLSYQFEGQYLNGKKVTEDQHYGQNLLDSTGLMEVKEDEDYDMGYAVAVRRTDLKAFPTSDRFFDTADDTQFDNTQSSVMLSGEAAVVYFTTKDNKWCLVRTYNCSGWVQAADLAMTDRDQWMNYWDPADFITITADRIEVAAPKDSGETSFRFYMGTRLPHTSGNKVLVPLRDHDGNMYTEEIDLGEGADVCVGALPYTRANVIRQAFKSLHLRYGWGGMFDARDCSSFVMDIYRCFGLNLARNTTWQPECDGVEYIFPDNSKQRLQLFKEMKPGTVLFFSGHEMLYLGSVNGQPYIIHSLSSYSNDGDEKIYANAVVVSDLNIMRVKTGKTFLDSLTVAVDFCKK